MSESAIQLPPRLFSEERLAAYVSRGHSEVQGWLAPVAIDMIRAIGKIQGRIGVSGDICEIGVHHGRLFLLLYLMLREGERALSVDLFKMQEQNVDGSGKGDLDKFLKNVDVHVGSRSGLECLEANSLHLRASDLLERLPQRARLFSVDGGHTAELTVNDLALGEACICPKGVLILDDYFNQAWPGVSEGTNSYMMRVPALRPFAIGGNKVLFAMREACNEYRTLLEQELRPLLFKKATFFGDVVSVFRPPPAT